MDGMASGSSWAAWEKSKGEALLRLCHTDEKECPLTLSRALMSTTSVSSSDKLAAGISRHGVISSGYDAIYSTISAAWGLCCGLPDQHRSNKVSLKTIII